MASDRTLKYHNYLTVSFPQSIMDLINQHSWEAGISKQEFIRQAVRTELTNKFGKDVELVIYDRIKQL
ncbi:MAG: ribbon-helix-helix protein, CopG family, partial [Cytophagia bacterium]|nr:ribbon-helix-helix protein, CopG family [Cytophagia bacterium]